VAERGRWPAIDPLASLSRLMPRLAGPEHLAAAARLRRLLASYEQQRDLVALGAYQPGSDPDADAAIERLAAIEEFLGQTAATRCSLADAIASLERVVA
jgi:flagellar biosynthesis/type III secretory pathway ATPase